MRREEHQMSTMEIRAHLLELAHERLAAEALGVRADGAYMADLEWEIAAYRHALVQASVTELAILRGELFGREFG
jgi:DTW domain-containing protein YfiP